MADPKTAQFPQVRVRFAPSPTGYLHIGGARTALFNFLFARHCGGRFILRIEDTDRKRFQQDALSEIFESLKWLGLAWDEGPDTGGEAGPYVQSQRLDLYRKHATRLLTEGNAYRCWCTAERLAAIRQEQEKSKTWSGSGYDRHCRDMNADAQDLLLSSGTPSAIRFKTPRTGNVVFEDLIRGSIEYQSEVLDDLILLKSDGFPTYHLANVVDDHLMGISHVLRGDEWIASTPRHILIYQAFGWSPPLFAHLPIILAPDGGKLSKRKGAASVLDYRKAGFLSEAIFNFLALLGWAPGDDREIMPREEIIRAFTLDRVSAKSAVLDEKKLEWMNGHYLGERSVDSVIFDVAEHWRKLGWITAEAPADTPFHRTIITLLKSRARRISDIGETSAYFFSDPKEYDLQAAKKHFSPPATQVLKKLLEKLETLTDFTHASLESVYRTCAEETALSAGKLIHPTRLAVSGVSAGPGLFELLETLGKETVIRRLRTAVDRLEHPPR